VRNIDWENLKGQIYEGINWSATPIIPNAAINWEDIDEDVITGVNWDSYLGGGDDLWQTGIDTKIYYSDGNVGLGTNDPTQQLELTGSIELPVTTSSTVGVVYYGEDRWLHSFQVTDTNGQNVFVGRQAGNFSMVYNNSNEDASGNTGVGDRSLDALTYGRNNTGIGRLTLSGVTTGSLNLAAGNQAGWLITTGNLNVGMGNYAIASLTTQMGNTAIGASALRGASTSAGDKNTAIGYESAMYQANGSTALQPQNSVYIGALTKGLDNSDDNAIVIGYDAIGIGANTVVLGNDSITTTALKGSVGIGTTAPTAKLHVVGGILPAKVTADPCGTGYPEGTLFYNDTSNYFCYCNGSADVKMSDDTTACF
jgi:hypothetical protein